MVYMQAKSNVVMLEPRMEATRNCIETLEDAIATVNLAEGEPELQDRVAASSLTGLLTAIVKVQLIQLKTALKEGQESLEHSQKVIAEIESPIKLFGRR